MVEVTVRDVIPADQLRIREIIDLSFPFFYRFFAANSVKETDEPLLVCEVDGKLVGFSKLIEFDVSSTRYGCILWIAVHPKFRRQGFALQLTNASIDCLKRRGCHSVFASTQRWNHGAQLALSAAGFESVGFWGLRGRFGWRVFGFYVAIWYAPGELVFWRRMDC